MPRASPATAGSNAPAVKRGAQLRPKASPRNPLDARRGIDTGTIAAAESIDPAKPLTEKQRDFVRFWAQGESLTVAAAKAGYGENSGNYAYRLCHQPNILVLYHEEKRKYEAAAEMSRKRVMDMLLEAYDVAKMVAEPSSMVGAAREIGKMCGYYEPVTIRHQVSVEGKVIHERLDRMTEQELLEYIAARQREIQHHPQGASNAALIEDASVVREPGAAQ